MDAGFAALIAAVLTAAGTITGAIVTRHGFSFWWPEKTVRFSGDLSVLLRLQGTGAYKVSDNPPLVQEVRGAVLKVRGTHCNLKGDYVFKRGLKTEVTGEFSGTGWYDSRAAFMSYQIVNTATGEPWFGVMVLYFPEWGNPFGYLLSRSVTQKGKTGVLFADLRY